MSDLIDREALLDELWKQRRNYQLMDDTHTADKIMHGLYRAEQVVKEAPAVNAAPRWVRCEDELPNVGEYVLAWEYGQFAIVDKYCGDGKWGLSDASARYSHWMPLPDAPGGEEE